MRIDKTVVLAAAAVATFGVLGAGPASAAVQASTAAATTVAVSVPVSPPTAPQGNDPWD